MEGVTWSRHLASRQTGASRSRCCFPFSQFSCAVILGALWVPRPAMAREIESPDVAAMVQSIVGVKAIVPSNARTAESLGTERLGSGIVIDSGGLIVTIGYLVMEASSVEVRTADGKVHPANIVAYDQASGFGLLRGQYGFKAKPMRLGRSAEVKVGIPCWRSAMAGRRACERRSWFPSANSPVIGSICWTRRCSRRRPSWISAGRPWCRPRAS